MQFSFFLWDFIVTQKTLSSTRTSSLRSVTQSGGGYWNEMKAFIVIELN